ncbi:MAG: extracellular solute-binding protein [Chloroflexi bacterium]|nr:extracellular solute-binding protein [Chloroflexota bacterium]
MDSQRDTLSRRHLLKLLSATTGALALGPVLAACAPPSAAPGGGTAAPAADDKVTLELWTFVNTHARWFRSMAESYTKEKNPNFTLNVSEIAYNDMHDKLLLALQSGGVGAPDLADIEQGRFGGFLRSEDTGLVDLADRLKEGGYLDKLVAAREALYSYQGKIYGIEHALTPVVLYYRQDLWKDAADPTKFTTWDDYIAGAASVAKDGVAALPFPPHEVILRQRGSDYFDKDGNVTIDSKESIETMDWILGLRDQHKIADQQPADDAWWAAVKDGKFVSVVGADWYAGFFKDNAPDLKGKWMATPLPAWTKDGIRTSCYGGTGDCIIKTSKHVDEAWNFQQYSMLSVDGNARRFEMTNLFPPLIPAMTDARLHKPDEYFNGQDLGAVFAEVGPKVPSQYQSPYRAEMNSKLTPLWQDIMDGKAKPADAFAQVAKDLRDKITADKS